MVQVFRIICDLENTKLGQKVLIEGTRLWDLTTGQGGLLVVRKWSRKSSCGSVKERMRFGYSQVRVDKSEVILKKLSLEEYVREIQEGNYLIRCELRVWIIHMENKDIFLIFQSLVFNSKLEGQ